MIHDTICESEKLNKVSLGAEALWVRILTHVDDNGNYDRDPLVVYATCLRFKKDVTVKDVERWLKELVDVRSDDQLGLLAEYKVKGRSYVHVVNFRINQDIRDDKTRTVSFPPHPVEIPEPAYLKTGRGQDVLRREAAAVPSVDSLRTVVEKPKNGLEGEVESEGEVEGEVVSSSHREGRFNNFRDAFKDALGRATKPKPYTSHVEKYQELCRRNGEEEVLDAINTFVSLHGKSTLQKNKFADRDFLLDECQDLIDAKKNGTLDADGEAEKTADATRRPAVQL